MANKQRPTAVTGDHNITGKYLNNVGNVENYITISHPVAGNSKQLTLESKVAFGALLESDERYPAPKCHPDTRINAKKVVKDWIGRRGFGSKNRIMWISGPPGVGKSAILQTVCEELSGGNPVDSEGDDSLVDACYFFGRGMGDREKASFFPATVAYQLVSSRSRCGDYIKGIIAKEPRVLTESFPSQFNKLVLGPAKAHPASEAPITIVIDALDECDSVSDQVALLNTIYEGATTANMCFVIASRPEEHIHTFFQSSTVFKHTYHIRLDRDFEASEDIERFLWKEFAGIRQRRPGSYCLLPNGEEWPGRVVIYQLRDDSDGQFIYPTLIIAFIDRSYPHPDKQLKSLLAAPPARAFSKLDTLYHHILFHCHPHDLPADELQDFRKIMWAILFTVVSWPDPLPVPGIAKVLDKEVHVVYAIIHGPMRSLFKFDSNCGIITLCHKSLRDYLLDYRRSQEFFLRDANTPDGLYGRILARQPPSDPSQCYRMALVDVLSVVALWGTWVKVPQIASFLGFARSLVKGVIFGPAKALFTLDRDGNVDFSTPSIKDFLLDVNRAREFFISRDRFDTHLTRVLSRQPPANPPQYYSRTALMDVLSVIVLRGNWVKVPQIASFLGVARSLVEGVIFGPVEVLFTLDRDGNVDFSTPSIKDFLLDVNRAREFFISRDRIDTHLTRILSRQPPSDPPQPYCRDLLKRVIKVLIVWERSMTMDQIASCLGDGVTSDEVKRLVSGVQLFYVHAYGEVLLMPEVEEFLLDSKRAGAHYIQPNDLNPHYDRMHVRIEAICKKSLRDR